MSVNDTEFDDTSHS